LWCIVRLKFFLSGLGNFSNNLAVITEAIIEGDKLGFNGALLPDHYMWGQMPFMRRSSTRTRPKHNGMLKEGRTHPRPNSMRGRMGGNFHSMINNSTLETWITLSYLAGKTEQIRLGTLVTPIPFRPPSVLAKMVSTLDILSEGRVVFGVGAGWSQPEFEGYSEWNPPKIRVDKTEEGLELMIKLWTQKEVTFKGTYYQTKGAVLEPKPVQKPYPPLLFGGRGDRMLNLAGRYADICYIMSQFQPPNVSEQMHEKVLRAARKANRVEKVAFMAGPMGSMAPFNLTDCSQRIEAAIETGASYYLTAFPRTTYLESMQRFTKEIMPSFK
jgi:alkanesulfonate monooxygenase SsuD/methylene tetrahydromethanopterin reductase-like flavin-dependent oxidoreductase (luciferase family)